MQTPIIKGKWAFIKVKIIMSIMSTQFLYLPSMYAIVPGLDYWKLIKNNSVLKHSVEDYMLSQGLITTMLLVIQTVI